LVLADDDVAFVGDTLFAMGCGRLFEGTAAQMYASLKRITSLPEPTRLYCAHEYTLSNARFAAHADPKNADVLARLRGVEQLRARGQITVPTSVAEERRTNPFVRASDEAELAVLRRRKDSFR
jgi:hydroxyacylglutathione hydrolase